MSEWENREATYEKAFEVDLDRRFRSVARRNKLIGLWAADKLGLADDKAQAYARDLVQGQVGQDDDEALALWLEGELVHLDPPLSGHRIRRRIGEFTAKAVNEVFQGR